MKKYLSHSISVALITLVFMGCKHDNIEPILGPQIVACPSEDFAFINPVAVSNNNPDFTTDSVIVSAQFNEKIPWEVILTGQTSGAAYASNGDGDVVSVAWYGESENGIFFRAGETVQVQIVSCDSTFNGPSVTVLAPKTPTGTLVDDFDGNGLATSWNNASGDLVFLGTRNDSVVPQGSNYMSLDGTDVCKGSYLGMMLHSPSSIAYGLPADSNNVYLNVIANGSSNAIMELRVQETDGDEYRYQVPVTWGGWGLISVRYADFIPQGATNGMDPNNCDEVRVALRSDNIGAGVQLNLDYIVFTTGGPFQP